MFKSTVPTTEKYTSHMPSRSMSIYKYSTSCIHNAFMLAELREKVEIRINKYEYECIQTIHYYLEWKVGIGTVYEDPGGSAFFRRRAEQSP